MNYNLLEEHWIPVLMKDGKYCRVGIKRALTQAGRIRQIAAMATHRRSSSKTGGGSWP